MLDFHPERDKFIDPVADKTWRSTNQDVERFIASDTEAKMRTFLQSAPDMFGAGDSLVLPADTDLASAIAARNMLQLALLARETSKSEEVVLSEKKLGRFCLVATEASEELQELLRERSQLINAAAELTAEDASARSFFEREAGHTCSFNPDAQIIGIGFDTLIPKGAYADFLMRMLQINDLATEARGISNHWSSEWCTISTKIDLKAAAENKADHLHLLCAMGYYENSESGIRRALSNLCDLLMTLHLNDVQTIAINGQEVRSIATGIGSLWWSALDAMRIGRLGACEVCGKPFIANNERGKKRKYCSEACKQWRKVHPGKTRMNADKPTPSEWARLDR